MPSTQYHIYFSNDYSFNPIDLAGPAVILVPDSDKWNDFGHKNRFYIRVFDDAFQLLFDGQVRLAFIEAEHNIHSSHGIVLDYLKKMRKSLCEAQDLPKFYTMLPDMQGYRKVVEQLQPRPAERLLLALNDLVALRFIGSNPRWLSEALESSELQLAFFRNKETFFAFHNAGSILIGLEAESLEGISNHFRLEFKLQAFTASHIVELDFEPSGYLPKRIAIIIGKNGVGKSQALQNIASSLLKGDESLTDRHGDPPIVSRLIAISSPGETADTFPEGRKRSPIKYERILLTAKPSRRRFSGFGDALVRLARSEESIKANTRWQLFIDSISSIAPIEELYVRNEKVIRTLDGRSSTKTFEDFALASFRSGNEQVRLERWGGVTNRSEIRRMLNGKSFPLSSGQSTFLKFAVYACLHIENGSLVLVDEPETHLHPNYITDFIQLLDRLLGSTGSLAIMATHSAYFVREVSRSQVYVFRETTGQGIEVVKPRLKTLGADIGQISHFVFEDERFGSLLDQVKETLINDRQNASLILKELEEELSTEALMNLRRNLTSDEEIK